MTDENEKEKIDHEFYDKHIGKIEKKPPNEELEFIKSQREQKSIAKEHDKVIAKEILEDIKEEYYDEIKDFSIDKLAKTNYLYQIFGSKHDKYKSSYYLKKEHKQMLAEGYPEGTLLNSYLFVAVVLRRLQIEFQQAHKAKAGAGVQQPEDFEMLESIQTLTDKMSKIQSALDQAKEASRTGQDVHDLHKKEVDAAAEFVKQNAGEFSFKCKTCQTIVTSGGLPHWAIISVEGNEVKYHIWSRELFRLVKKGLMPLHYMAFALHTSLEGLKYTAELRGEKLPEFDINDEETKLRELMNGFEEIEDKRQR